MNNVDKLLIKNDLPENEYEKFRIYSEVFYNVPPIIILHAFKCKNELEHSLSDYLNYWHNYCSKYGAINLLNLGLLPENEKKCTEFLNEKLEALARSKQPFVVPITELAPLIGMQFVKCRCI